MRLYLQRVPEFRVPRRCLFFEPAGAKGREARDIGNYLRSSAYSIQL